MAVDFDKLMSVFREALEEHPPEQWDEFVQQAAGHEARHVVSGFVDAVVGDARLGKIIGADLL